MTDKGSNRAGSKLRDTSGHANLVVTGAAGQRRRAPAGWIWRAVAAFNIHLYGQQHAAGREVLADAAGPGCMEVAAGNARRCLAFLSSAIADAVARIGPGGELAENELIGLVPGHSMIARPKTKCRASGCEKSAVIGGYCYAHFVRSRELTGGHEGPNTDAELAIVERLAESAALPGPEGEAARREALRVILATALMAGNVIVPLTLALQHARTAAEIAAEAAAREVAERTNPYGGDDEPGDESLADKEACLAGPQTVDNGPVEGIQRGTG